MEPKPQHVKAKIWFQLGKQMEGMPTLSECVSSFSTYPRKDEVVVAHSFDDACDGHRLMTRLETLERSQFVSPRFSTKVQNWYHVVGSSRNGDSISEWCEKNYERFWKLSRDNDGKYNIISLSGVAKKLFRNILQGLRFYHDAKSGHGNLTNGVMVTPDGEITFFNEDFASLENPMGFEKIMADDVKSFRVLFEDAMTTVGQRLAEVKNIHIKGNQHPAVIALKELYGDLHKYLTKTETLKQFTFYLMNNPIFMNTNESYMFMKKFIDLSDGDWVTFDKKVSFYQPDTDLQDWGKFVRREELREVFAYLEGPYQEPENAAYFIRNALRHVKEKHKDLDNGIITDMILEDLPFLLPKWWLALIRGLGNDPCACNRLFQSKDLIAFLKKPPSLMG